MWTRSTATFAFFQLEMHGGIFQSFWSWAFRLFKAQQPNDMPSFSNFNGFKLRSQTICEHYGAPFMTFYYGHLSTYLWLFSLTISLTPRSVTVESLLLLVFVLGGKFFRRRMMYWWRRGRWSSGHLHQNPKLKAPCSCRCWVFLFAFCSLLSSSFLLLTSFLLPSCAWTLEAGKGPLASPPAWSHVPGPRGIAGVRCWSANIMNQLSKRATGCNWDLLPAIGRVARPEQ